MRTALALLTVLLLATACPERSRDCWDRCDGDEACIWVNSGGGTLTPGTYRCEVTCSFLDTGTGEDTCVEGTCTGRGASCRTCDNELFFCE